MKVGSPRPQSLSVRRCVVGVAPLRKLLGPLVPTIDGWVSYILSADGALGMGIMQSFFPSPQAGILSKVSAVLSVTSTLRLSCGTFVCAARGIASQHLDQLATALDALNALMTVMLMTWLVLSVLMPTKTLVVMGVPSVMIVGPMIAIPMMPRSVIPFAAMPSVRVKLVMRTLMPDPRFAIMLNCPSWPWVAFAPVPPPLSFPRRRAQRSQ